MDVNAVVRYFLIRTIGSTLLGGAMAANTAASIGYFLYFLFLWLVSDVLMFTIRQLNKPDWQ